MPHIHEHHHFELYHALHSPMSKLYFFHSILTFVKTLVGIFVPVFLYKLGFSVSLILTVSIISSFTYLVFVPLFVKLIGKIGFKFTILVSIPIYFSHLISLYIVESYPSAIVLVGLSFGIYLASFWPCFHSEIALRGDKLHRGNEIGNLQIFATLFATLAPLIGGVLFEFFGYLQVLILSCFLLVVALFPLLASQDLKLEHYQFRYRDYLRFSKNKSMQFSKKAFAYEGIHSSLSFLIWPIVLFILLNKNFLTLGALFSVVSLISIFVMIIIKKYIDTHKKEDVLKKFWRVLSINWFFRAMLLFISSLLLYLVEAFYKITQSAFFLPYFSLFYDNAKKNKFMDYIIMREWYLHKTKIIFHLILIFVLLTFGETMLVFGALILLGALLPVGLSSLREEVEN